MFFNKIFTDKKRYKRFSNSGKLVHRWMAEKKIGGKIGRGRVVHHKDGDKGNFRASNLRVMSRSAHSRFHARLRAKRKSY